ncbi:MAG: NAD-dependent epimerase/dehydratase family protein [Planctomyces sp.]
MQSIGSEAELEEVLSRPDAAVLQSVRELQGDFVVLGAGGKMGPTLCRMLQRALDAAGGQQRRVLAVSRFQGGGAAAALQQHGIETLSCDLLDRDAVARLPDAENVIFMAGQKFGTSGQPEQTWAMNVLVPAIVAERYRASRIVVFSTGCVYPLMPVTSCGAREDAPLTPPGEYASSCVGRERMFDFAAQRYGTQVLQFRLCYAIDLRYGVLLDVATRVAAGQPVDVSMGWVQVIWQGDACSRAIQSLQHAASPAVALNVTGPRRISVRELAQRFGERLGCSVQYSGTESTSAWLWDATRSCELFGEPQVSVDEMIEATAAWVQRGGRVLNKPTHFEVRDGNY